MEKLAVGGPDAAESDECLIARVREGQVSRFAVLVQRHNRSLFRVARSIVRNADEAEDVVQQTHVSAFIHLHQFEGRSKFSTWLARIAAHEALARINQQRRSSGIAQDGAWIAPSAQLGTPEEIVSRSELARTLESAIDALPHPYRAAFVLRHVEGLASDEAAAWLGVTQANLRVLVHRARLLLKQRILEQVQETADEVFSFGGERCARVTERVLRIVSTGFLAPGPVAKFAVQPS